MSPHGSPLPWCAQGITEPNVVPDHFPGSPIRSILGAVMSTTNIPRQFTLDEAAEVARRTPKAMRQLRARDIERAKDGRPPVGPRFRWVAGRLMVDEDELARWLKGDDES